MQKWHRKSHLITTAILPLHGFLIVLLAETRACFIKSLHWSDWGRNISYIQNCAIQLSYTYTATIVSKPQKCKVHLAVIVEESCHSSLLYKCRYLQLKKQEICSATFLAITTFTKLEYGSDRREPRIKHSIDSSIFLPPYSPTQISLGKCWWFSICANLHVKVLIWDSNVQFTNWCCWWY